MFYSSYATVILCLFLWNIYKPSYSGMQRVWAHLAKVHILLIFEVKRSKNNLCGNVFKSKFSANVNAQLLYVWTFKNN